MSDWSEERRHDEMRSAFARAERAHRDGIHEVWYSFGSHAVRTRIIGSRLAQRLASPFQHLQWQGNAPSAARLTIDLWDQLEAGIAADIDVAPDPLGVSSSFSSSDDERFVTSVLQHSITSFDRQEERIVGVALDADRLSLYERGRPLHVPLALWYNDIDIPLIHAALVSHEGSGVLLAGPSSVGKTTSSMSCMAAGFRYLADDLAGLEIRPDGSPWGHSVYGSAFVDEQTFLRLPGVLDEHAIPGRYDYEDKQLVLLHQTGSAALMSHTKIQVIALVQIADEGRTRVRPATKGESLLAMARSSLQGGVLSPGKRGFELLGRLSDGVPSFWLELGTDAEETPKRLRDLLSGLPDATERSPT